MKKMDSLLAVIFFIFAGVYLAYISRLPYPGDWIIKMVPALALAVTAFLFIPGATGKILAVGFIFSAGGDVALSFEGDKNFMIGLGLFLVAHIFYILAFSRKTTVFPSRIPFMIAIVVFAIVMVIVLAPKLGDLKIPVFVYVAVIATMGVFAGLRADVSYLLLIGALIFMVSDSLIAVNKFLVPVPYAKYFIMTTYWAGQYIICRSFILSSSAST